jgi:hypothetical protein
MTDDKDKLLPVHRWRDTPEVKTTPIMCLLCGDKEASVVVYTPHGCTCSPNKIQPRCEHHLMRAYDTGEDYTIIEDFRIYAPEKDNGND